jgi:hypothetical protein
MIHSDCKYWQLFENVQDAKLYIDMLIIDDYNNWRVPTAREYVKIRNKFPEICEQIVNNGHGIAVLYENINLLLALVELSFKGYFVIPVKD